MNYRYCPCGAILALTDVTPSGVIVTINGMPAREYAFHGDH